MYNFQPDIQSLGLNDFQTGEVTVWDPQTQSYYVTYDSRQYGGGCWSGWRCWGGWHRCGGRH
ncbi:heterocycloanthracin/sonorensin family bacteriocin [Bacillus gaemokensis]|uniref:heterocycloanthracin/sonorensin family bacteriocin n=1 Tax=Bacillus gaemokensis TaxID=574375 RepID=UPI0005357639|nr:heterocycloanthracin/sonorensin family bacteriocin [Bacillus gaemokensis]KYG30064.1 hypothetical protein AZF08_11965 [Bacillus gaemokensis]